MNGEKREKKKGTKAPSDGQKDERKSDQREKWWKMTREKNFKRNFKHILNKKDYFTQKMI